MVNRLRINSEQLIFFWNITRCQVISPVVNHVLVRGFVIQQVILIFIKFLSQTAILQDVNEGKSYSVWSDLYQSQTTTYTLDQTKKKNYTISMHY